MHGKEYIHIPITTQFKDLGVKMSYSDQLVRKDGANSSERVKGVFFNVRERY